MRLIFQNLYNLKDGHNAVKSWDLIPCYFGVKGSTKKLFYTRKTLTIVSSEKPDRSANSLYGSTDCSGLGVRYNTLTGFIALSNITSLYAST